MWPEPGGGFAHGGVGNGILCNTLLCCFLSPPGTARDHARWRVGSPPIPSGGTATGCVHKAPLRAAGTDSAGHKNWKTQLYGISDKFAFGEFTFDQSQPDPTVTYRLIDDDGKSIYTLTLP